MPRTYLGKSIGEVGATNRQRLALQIKNSAKISNHIFLKVNEMDIVPKTHSKKQWDRMLEGSTMEEPLDQLKKKR